MPNSRGRLVSGGFTPTLALTRRHQPPNSAWLQGIVASGPPSASISPNRPSMDDSGRGLGRDSESVSASRRLQISIRNLLVGRAATGYRLLADTWAIRLQPGPHGCFGGSGDDPQPAGDGP